MGQARDHGETARWPPWSRAGVDDTACHSVITHRRATVLAGKLEIIIFQEAVHEDDEFAHAGGHGDEGFLAGGAQAQIKLYDSNQWHDKTSPT